MTPTFPRKLRGAFPGKRICVMGGAPCLASDLLTITADIYISVNGHGADIRRPSFLVAMDQIHTGTQEPMGTYLHARSSAPIISPNNYADVRLADWPLRPRRTLSGHVAIWVAQGMGASEVVLAGFDGYAGDPQVIEEARLIAPFVTCPVRTAYGPIRHTWPEG